MADEFKVEESMADNTIPWRMAYVYIIMFRPDAQLGRLINRTPVDQLAIRMVNPGLYHPVDQPAVIAARPMRDQRLSFRVSVGRTYPVPVSCARISRTLYPLLERAEDGGLHGAR